MILKIIAVIFLLTGFAIVIGAKKLVQIFKLEGKVKVESEYRLNDNEIADYKYNKAVLNIKSIGTIIAFPGVILTLIAFK